MTERLRTQLQKYLIKKGPTGKSSLSLVTGKSARMIERYLNGSSNPSEHTAFLLAQESGSNEAQALALAKECSAGGQRKAS